MKIFAEKHGTSRRKIKKMTSCLENYNNVGNFGGEIGKEALQLVLRPKLGKQVIVVKSSTSLLLPPGENFACSIFKVRALIKRDEKKPEEEEVLQLVAKTFPPSEIMQEIFDFKTFFKKEIFFYEKLMLVYKYLDVDFGANDLEAFDIAPKFYGARGSIKSDDGFAVDDSVIILMQNLKVKGYYTGDKVKGLYQSLNCIYSLYIYHTS